MKITYLQQQCESRKFFSCFSILLTYCGENCQVEIFRVFFVLRWFCCYFCLLLCHSEPEKRWQTFFSVRILSALCCWVHFGKFEKWWGGNLLVSCAEFSVKVCGCMGPLWVYSKLLLSFLKISIEIWFNLNRNLNKILEKLKFNDHCS